MPPPGPSAGVILMFVTLAGTLSACSQPRRPEPMFAMHAAETCPPSSSVFFPNGIFEAASSQNQGERSSAWASRILAAMGEPSLSCGPAQESYRLVWIHSFSNWQPTALRISHHAGRWTVIAVRLQNAVNQNVAERREKILTDEESALALAAFSRFGLWQKSALADEPDGNDGATWIVEGRKGTGYHAVLRFYVDRDALGELASTLFRVSGMNPGQLSQ